MDAGLALIARLVESGVGNLAAYLAAHVLLCLLPAFFIAGGMTALIPKEAITRFLGRNTRRTVSYPAAAAAGSHSRGLLLDAAPRTWQNRDRRWTVRPASAPPLRRTAVHRHSLPAHPEPGPLRVRAARCRRPGAASARRGRTR